MSRHLRKPSLGYCAFAGSVEALEPRLQLSGNFSLPTGTPPIVRVGYVIPSNRTPQADGVATLQAALPRMQSWYRDQMERYGLGSKSFVYETEADGTTPKVHVVNVTESDAYLRANIWSNTAAAASNAGVPLWSNGQVWLLIPECHLQNADASITGGTALGASFGSGTDGGVGMIGSNGLAVMRETFVTNNSGYGGMTIPELGPYPLVQNTSFQWYEGSTLSGLASSYYGAALHELSHGFGLPHDFRNDENADGNLMGNGLRGFNGAIYPELYPANDTFLTYGHALALSTSRYFNTATAPEAVRPAVNVSTTGSVTISSGKLTIAFTASDASGLAAAWLLRGGELVAELPLAGTSVNTSFSIAEYDVASAQTFEVVAFDVYGNRQSASSSITPVLGGGAGANRAPRPAIDSNLTTLGLGQTFTLDATRTTDPDHSASTLTVEWDLNNDGVYETAPTTTKTYSVWFGSPGTRVVRARLKDPSGAISLSAPLPIRILPTYFGTGAADSLIIQGNADPNQITIVAGSKTLTMPRTQTLRFSGGGGADLLTVALGAGEARLDLGSSAVNLTLQNGTTGLLARNQSVGTLTLQGNARLDLKTGSATVLSVASFSFSSQAKLDVKDNRVALSNSGQVATARSLLLTGRAGGAWTGAGITSSLAAADPSRRGLMLSPGASAPVIVYGPAGDINGSGVINADDYFVMDQAYLTSTVYGDLNFDGGIDIDDYFVMDRSIALWLGPGAPLGVFAPTPIPGGDDDLFG